MPRIELIPPRRARMTDAMIEALRKGRGWSDAEVTDCFWAISYRNGVERDDRLLAGVPSG